MAANTGATSLLALSVIAVVVSIVVEDVGASDKPRPIRQFTIDRTRANALEYPLRHSGVISVVASARATSFNPSSRDVRSDKAALVLVLDDPWNVAIEVVDAAVVAVVMVAKRSSIEDK